MTLPIKRIFDVPKTPYQRLITANILSDRSDLVAYFDTRIASTNPRKLRKEIYVLREQLFNLPAKEPGVTEDVRLTLLPSIPFVPEQSLLGVASG